MNTQQQHFTLAMCRHLSSLVPGFQGHYWWIKRAIFEVSPLVCGKEPIIEWQLDCHEDPSPYQEAVPAWQMEDVLRNLRKIIPINETRMLGKNTFKITHHLIINELCFHPNTAYQKIEEYLWSILK